MAYVGQTVSEMVKILTSFYNESGNEKLFIEKLHRTDGASWNLRKLLKNI